MYHDPPAATAAITLSHLSLEEGEAWIKNSLGTPLSVSPVN
jgi:hypothetical protein